MRPPVLEWLILTRCKPPLVAARFVPPLIFATRFVAALIVPTRFVAAFLVATRFALLTRFRAAFARFASIAIVAALAAIATVTVRTERGPFFAGGFRLSTFSAGRFPTHGRAFGLFGREDLQFGLFRAFGRSREARRRWHGRLCRRLRRRSHRNGGNLRARRGFSGRGGDGSGLRSRLVGAGRVHRGFPRERILVLGLRSDDLDRGRLVSGGASSGSTGRRGGSALAAGKPRSARDTERTEPGRGAGIGMGRATAGIAG